MDSLINKNYCFIELSFFKVHYCHISCSNNDISSNYPLSGIIIRIYINFIFLTSLTKVLGRRYYELHFKVFKPQNN